MFGPGADEALVWYEGSGTSDRRWLLADQLGSIVAVTNGAGAATAINTYDEYGAPGASNTGRFGFTGQAWLPEAQLYHYKARAYLPSLGRFAQTDPAGFGGGMNLYGYVGNDPVNWTDPSGLVRDRCFGCNWKDGPGGPPGSGFQDDGPIDVYPPDPCDLVPCIRGANNISEFLGHGGNISSGDYYNQAEYREEERAERIEEEAEIVVTAQPCMTVACQQSRWDEWQNANRGLAGDLFLEGAGFIIINGALVAATGGVAAAGKSALPVAARFLGPRGPVFGDTAFGAARQGLLNSGRVRFGWGRGGGVANLRFGIGNWKSPTLWTRPIPPGG